MPTTLTPAALRLEDAAQYVAMSEAWLREAARTGQIACTRLGRSLRFRVADLDQLLEERTTKASPPTVTK